MVVHGATSGQLFVTNYARVSNGRSDHYSYSDQGLIDLFKGQLLTAAGFYALAYSSYRLLYADRP